MKNKRRDSAVSSAERNQTSSNRQSRRQFLVKTGGILAAGAFGAVPLRGWAADPVNIGALYPTTGFDFGAYPRARSFVVGLNLSF